MEENIAPEVLGDYECLLLDGDPIPELKDMAYHQNNPDYTDGQWESVAVIIPDISNIQVAQPGPIRRFFQRFSQASLPESATVRLQEQPYLRNAFKEPIPASRSGLDDLFARTRGTVQHAAVVSGGSFDVLKAFVANGWAPIVMIQFQGRTPEILPISDYNNQLSEVSLQNPTNLSKRRLTYKEFEAAWRKNSQNKCVLVTPQQITEVNLKKVLARYLPAEAFQQVSIRSR